MAKLTGPLASFSARGSIAKLVTYQKKRAGWIAHRFLGKRQEPSEDQALVRYWMGQAVIAWQALSLSTKQAYNELAKGLALTGYNFYVSEYVKTYLVAPPPPPPPDVLYWDMGHLWDSGRVWA